MADTTETVIFKVDISSYEEGLATLTKSIKGLQDQRAIYEAQAKKGDSEAAKQVEALNVQIKNTQQEYRTTQKVLQGYTAAQQKQADTMNFLNNSIQTNRDLLKQMSAQLLNTINPSQKLIDKTKQLSDTLKKQESALGDTRRNVGNYSEAFKSAFSIIGKGASSAGGDVAGLAASLSGGGIGVGIAVVGQLISVFQSLGGVADKVDQIVNGISGGFKALITGGNALEAARQIAGITSELQQLEEAEARSVLTNERIGASIKHLELLAKDRGKTEDERIKLYSRANDLALKQFQDDTKRLQEVAKLEEEKFAKSFTLSKLEVDVALENNETIKKSYDYLTDAQIDAARDKVGRVVKLDGEEVKKLISNRVELSKTEERYQDVLDRNAVRSNKLADERDAKNQKIADDETARQNKLAAERKAYLDNLHKLEDEFNLTERETLAKSFDDKKNTITGQSQEEINLRLSIEQSKQAALDAYDNGIELKKKEKRDKELADFKKVQEEKEKALNDSLKKQEDAYQKNSDAQRKNTDDLLNEQQKKFDNIITIVTAVNNAIISILQTTSDWINRSAQEQIDSLETQAKRSSITQKQFEAETREIKLKAWKQSKAIAITEASMNTANAIMAQLSNPTPYVGYVLAALAAATGAAQIAFIATQKPPKFAKGGRVIDIDGQSHENGGTPIHVNGRQVAEAEKDEGLFIMKKNAYQEMKKYSDWNQAFGGNSWGVKTNHAALGGNIASVSDGGFVTREVMNNVNNAEMMRVAVSDALRKQAAPVVSVVEIDRVNKARNKSVRVAGL